MNTSKNKAKKATADKGLKRQVETEDVQKVTSNDKKLASNQRRLEALKKRRQEATTRVPVSISVDGRPTCSPGKHIVFASDSDHENSGSGETEETLSRKPSLFDEEEEEEDEEDASRFATRKQFGGSSGEKLFRLQQQIGTDKRFRLDERFADSNSSNDEDSSESSDDTGSDGDIEKERDQARRIIASLLGTTGSEAKNKAISSPSLLRHFDPSDGCTDLEQTDRTPPFKHKSDDDLILEEEESSSPSPAPVGRETYYKISNSLKESLTGRDEEREIKPHTFDFFAGEEDAIDEDDRDSAEEESETTTVTPKWMKSITRKSMPNSGAEEEEEEKEDRGGTSHKDRKAVSSPDSSQRVLFFFHSSDPILANRLDENSFYRNKTAAELCEKWPERRAAVKLAYKRSQKQALKRTRKRDW